jgi:drug/metabolite transporter (DMT)-like permease
VSLGRAAPRLFVAVLFGGAIGPVLLAAGLVHIPAASASLLLNLELVFTVVVAALLFHEHIGRRVGIGTVLVVAGGVVLTWSEGPQLRWAALLIAAACACWAIDNSVTAALDDLAPAHITLAKGLIAGTANLVIGLTAGGIPPRSAVLGSLAIGGFGYGLSITLWVAGARDLGAARGQLVFATAPFIGAAVAWTVLGDPIGGRQIVSILLAAAGASFVLRSEHQHLHEHPAVEHDHEHTHEDDHHDHRHDDGFTGRHQHVHRHHHVVHQHPHVPDIHHRHDHAA